MLQIIAIALIAQLALASPILRDANIYTLPQGLGDGLWRTFSSALIGKAPQLPASPAVAEEQGWVAQNGGACNADLGILYSHSANGSSTCHPLSVYFTAGGQIAGVAVSIYGVSSSAKIGDAAQAHLVDLGLWREIGTKKEWTMSISFRDSASMCDATIKSPLALGDRLVINQDTIKLSIPLTAVDAKSAGFVKGSCMKTMGQHWFLDTETVGAMSYNASNLFPVVPMYYPPDETGTINAFFFTTPVVQPGSWGFGAADWETPALIGSAMCKNWCDDKCKWSNSWSTMHIYLNSQWKTLTCPGGSGVVDRSCN